jgi:hypothetical protein
LQPAYVVLSQEQSTVVGQGFGWSEGKELVDALVIAVIAGNQGPRIGANAYQEFFDAIAIGIRNRYSAATLVCG